MPETEGESTCDRVKTLFVDGLGMKDSQFRIEKALKKGDPNTTRNCARVTTLKDNGWYRNGYEMQEQIKEQQTV